MKEQVLKFVKALKELEQEHGLNLFSENNDTLLVWDDMKKEAYYFDGDKYESDEE